MCIFRTTVWPASNDGESDNDVSGETSKGFLNHPAEVTWDENFCSVRLFPVPTAIATHFADSWSRQIVRQLWWRQQPVSSTGRTCGCRRCRAGWTREVAAAGVGRRRTIQRSVARRRRIKRARQRREIVTTTPRLRVWSRGPGTMGYSTPTARRVPVPNRIQRWKRKLRLQHPRGRSVRGERRLDGRQRSGRVRTFPRSVVGREVAGDRRKHRRRPVGRGGRGGGGRR